MYKRQAQDISYWDIALAGGILIHEPQNRSLVYGPWTLADGKEIPAVAGWQFYKPVSYTHLDVYKRQLIYYMTI